MDKKTISAFLLIGLILLLMPYYYKLISPPREETADSLSMEKAPSTLAEGPSEQAEMTRQEAEILPRKTTELEEARTGGESGVREWYAPDPIEESRIIDVETPLYSAQFSTHGASLHSWIVKPTLPFLQEQEQLVRLRDSNRNLVLLARGGRGLFRSEEKNFTPDTDQIILNKGDGEKSVTFALTLGSWGYYQETYTFYPDRYSFDVHIQSLGLSDATGAANALFTWGSGLAQTEKDSAQDLYYTEAYYYMGSSREKLKSSGKKIAELAPTGPTRWVAQRNKYFLLAIVPETPANGAHLATFPDSLYNGKFLPKLYETGLNFNLTNGDLDKKLIVYFGPLSQRFLNLVDPTLKDTMSWGWTIIKPFSIAVLWTLKFLHGFIPNYGLVLIIFSIMVKLIIWPLTQKSYVSMKRMQMLQPKMKALQEKYKGNPQKLQQEMGALYKEHKVNPLGGCLPTLLQLPLLYALFIVFRSTIELRGAPFVLWITDLSMPDVLVLLPFSIPLYGNRICVLPLVMAISTFLQSKTTITDPNQKAMLYIMPIMFIFLFNSFPSGLTLYYTLFNLLSWIQQHYMKVSDPKIEKELADLKTEQAKAARKKGISNPK